MRALLLACALSPCFQDKQDAPEATLTPVEQAKKLAVEVAGFFNERTIG